MKLSQICESPKQDIIPSSVSRMLDGDFKQATELNHFLYRGGLGLSRQTPQLLDPSKHRTKRKSLTGSNNLMLLLDYLPSWKEFPDRRKSIIFTTSMDLAGGFGVVNQLYPKNGAKLGVSTELNDFNDPWPTMKTVATFNPTVAVRTILREIRTVMVETYNVPNSVLSTHDNDVIVYVRNFDKALSKMGLHLGKDIFSDTDIMDYKFPQEYATLTQFLDQHLLNPEKNGFKVMSLEDLNSLPKKIRGYEIWTEAQCLVVPLQDYSREWE